MLIAFSLPLSHLACSLHMGITFSPLRAESCYRIAIVTCLSKCKGPSYFRSRHEIPRAAFWLTHLESSVYPSTSLFGYKYKANRQQYAVAPCGMGNVYGNRVAGELQGVWGDWAGMGGSTWWVQFWILCVRTLSRTSQVDGSQGNWIYEFKAQGRV